MGWNHNTQYHDFVLSAVPRGCRRALDAGCGEGALARKLARSCEEVVGIDADAGCIARAKAAADAGQNITFVQGDVLVHPLPPGGLDFVVTVATLHHLPLRAALQRLSDLVRPGGVLVVVGLYRIVTPVDYAFSATALPISWAIRLLRGDERVGAPIREPSETLRTIRRESDFILPGAVVRRQFFFRYTLLWKRS